MAKAARKTVSRAKKAGPAVPTGTDLLEARNKLVAQMGELLDEVDAAVSGQRNVNWSYPQPNTKLGRLRAKQTELNNAMYKLLQGEPLNNGQQVFHDALATPGGQVPSLARPGQYLEWLAYVPVLVSWTGFIGRSLSFYAADPTEPFFSETGFKSSHVSFLNATEGVPGEARDKLGYEMADSKFTLHTLRGDYCEYTAYRMAMNPWILEAVARGPVNPLPLPRRLHARQQSLFV